MCITIYCSYTCEIKIIRNRYSIASFISAIGNLETTNRLTGYLVKVHSTIITITVLHNYILAHFMLKLPTMKEYNARDLIIVSLTWPDTSLERAYWLEVIITHSGSGTYHLISISTLCKMLSYETLLCYVHRYIINK